MYKLGFIGGGNMATAILKGSLAFLSPDQIVVSDPDTDKLSVLAKLGVATTTDNSAVVANSEFVLFAVKPQYFSAVAEVIRGVLSGARFISIMAGLKISTIKKLIGNVKLARVMPNMPAMVGQGMSAIAFDGYDEQEQQFVKSIFSACGKVVFTDESKMDAVTSISGSGPAYVYYFIQAMTEGGVEGGLSAEEAKILAIQTVIGGAEMALRSDDLNASIDAVCSKGGTTIRAIDCFRENHLDEIIKQGIADCRNRSKELSNA